MLPLFMSGYPKVQSNKVGKAETVMTAVGRKKLFLASLKKTPKGKKGRMPVKVIKTDYYSKSKDKMASDICKKKKMESWIKRRQYYDVDADDDCSGKEIEKMAHDTYKVMKRERLLKRQQVYCVESDEGSNKEENNVIDQQDENGEEVSEEVEPHLVVDDIGATQEWPEDHEILKF